PVSCLPDLHRPRRRGARDSAGAKDSHYGKRHTDLEVVRNRVLAEPQPGIRHLDRRDRSVLGEREHRRSLDKYVHSTYYDHSRWRLKHPATGVSYTGDHHAGVNKSYADVGP